MSDFNSVLYSIIGQKIKSRREELNLSQLQLAETVSKVYKLERSSISNIERGRQQPPIHILYEICKILNLDIQTILPTYSEVDSQIIKESEPAIEKYMNSMDMDDQIRQHINNLINKTKK